jgi:hypothetical protein
MVPVRILKVPSPAAKGVKGLPEFTERLMGLASSEIDAILEEIKVHGQAIYMQRFSDPGPGDGIGLRLELRALRFSECQLEPVGVSPVDQDADKLGE